MKTLAQLVHPFGLITGFGNDEETEIFGVSPPANDIQIYRQYQRKVIPVELKGMEEISHFIEQHEHPDFMIASKEAHHIIFKLKIPTLIYFYDSIDAEFLRELKQISLYYKEYFVLTLVNRTKPNRWTRKLVDFMQIKEFPSLRILNVQEYVQRYRFIGSFDIELVEFFIQNYLHNHLKPY